MNILNRNVLHNAYLNTTYFVEAEHSYEICPLEINHKFSEFLIDRDILSWAIITSDNPLSRACTESENEIKRSELSRLLESHDYKTMPASGKGRLGDWPSEHGFFIKNIHPKDAVAIGRKFGQNAVFIGTYLGESEVKWIEYSSSKTVEVLLATKIFGGSAAVEKHELGMLKDLKINPQEARGILVLWRQEGIPEHYFEGLPVQFARRMKDLSYKQSLVNQLERSYERDQN